MDSAWNSSCRSKAGENPNQIVCWTRMQSESGQELSAIIRRKEIERDANGGLFVWGVGNAPNRAISALARLRVEIPVIFSLMKSAPKAYDSSPAGIIIWRRYVDMFGDVKSLPKASLVTSREKVGSRKSHYALICRSEASLDFADHGPFDHRAHRNVGVVGAKVGPSQVTALLERESTEQSDSGYRANMVAKLAGSYWVKLVDPIKVSGRRQLEMLQELTSLDIDNEGWASLVGRLRSGEKSSYVIEPEWQLPFSEV